MEMGSLDVGHQGHGHPDQGAAHGAQGLRQQESSKGSVCCAVLLWHLHLPGVWYPGKGKDHHGFRAAAMTTQDLGG